MSAISERPLGFGLLDLFASDLEPQVYYDAVGHMLGAVLSGTPSASPSPPPIPGASPYTLG